MMDQLNKTEDLVRIEGLTKIFGRHHRKAAELFKAGKTREEVYKATQCSVGVHDINFTIRRGELFVVMGLSGSGKSTLIRTINRLIEPSDGKIFIDDTEVTALSRRQLRDLRRRRIGMGAQPFRRISLRSPGRPVSGRKRDFSGGSPSGGSPGVSFLDPSPSPRCANFTGASALSAYPYSTIPHRRLPAWV